MSESNHEPSFAPAPEIDDEELLGQLADDFAARRRRGEHPTVEEYTANYPPLAERIRKVLSAAAMMEQSAPPDLAACERLGSTIGRYKLLERIGEGGFGVVYMAEQITPVRRKLALKVLKPGMDSRQVLARFEAERQALAIMDHPNIARVFDAGATDSGRPYFVMELVKGVPITEFCDQHQVAPRERLELFAHVCHAVQHAHQKGIIHRDIKPTNVLVMMHDTEPVVKVIDFGIAKALGQELTEKTLFTGFAQLLGTPLYMSPEQAGQSALDVDTRSDIYSMGVLLYELLTGTTPFEKERFKKAAHDEIRRIIRDEEPPRPSTRLSTSKETLLLISTQRRMEPAKLTKLVRGELDWIVMKALEKDRGRRYETATGLARDIERYLHDEPVKACPPSAGYRLRKFVRRHRGPVAAAGLVLLALLGGIAGTTWGLLRAEQQRQLAEAKKQEALAERDAKDLALQSELQARADETKARQQAFAALRSMTADVVERKFAQATVLTEDDRAFLRGVITQYDAFATIRGDDPESQAVRAEGRLRVGSMRHRLGELADAEVAYRNALALYEPLAGEFPGRPEFQEGLARSQANLALLLSDTGRSVDAEAAYRDALAVRTQLVAESPERPEFRQDLAATLNRLGVLLSDTDRPVDAEAAFRDALALNKSLTAELPGRPELWQDLANTQNNQGVLFRNTDREPDAEASFRDALTIRKQLAAEFPARPELRRELATGHDNLANVLYSTGRLSDAERAYRDALAIRKQLAADFPALPEFRWELARSLNNLGLFIQFTGRPTEAEPLFNDALAIYRTLAADFPSRPDLRHALAATLFNMAVLCNERHEFRAAKAYIEEAGPHHQAALQANPRHPDYRLYYRNYWCALAVANARLNDPSAAVRAAEALRDLGWNPPEDAYSAACALARCVARGQTDSDATDEERDRAVRFYGDAAMTLLRDALSKGYKDVANLKQDRQVDPLRQREDFQSLIAELASDAGEAPPSARQPVTNQEGGGR